MEGIREQVEASAARNCRDPEAKSGVLQSPRHDIMALHDYESRQQRLREIMEELKSMIDWMKS
jgi:hypothetical protein